MKINDAIDNWIVGHNAFNNVSLTGFPVIYDVPKSPCRHPKAHEKYCFKNGSLSPKFSLTIFNCSFVYACPLALNINWAGSFGDRYINKNDKNEIPINIGIKSINLFFIYFFNTNPFPNKKTTKQTLIH